jgi:predicted porin
MIGGGMSQSRWGINITEDLGGGLAAIANLEARFLADTGEQAATSYFQQSWVGIRSSSFGQITMGRQYNMLFDLVTST